MIDVLVIISPGEILRYISYGLARYDNIRVTSAASQYEGLRSLERRLPSIVVLDAHIRQSECSEVVSGILRRNRIPVIALSYSSRVRNTMLKNGAVSFHHQPPIDNAEQMNSFVKVLAEDIYRRFTCYNTADQSAARPYSRHGVEIIAIGASTGGTSAIEEILARLSTELPPIIVTQHMPSGFTGMFAKRLDQCSPVRVIEAADNMRLEKGMCVIASGGKFMELFRDNEGYYVRSREGEKVGGLCPTVDVMFESTAQAAGDKAIAFLLTGMGADGAQGMLALRRKGAYTVCQDRDSCAVYGMPMEAMQLGAACMEMSLSDIPGFINRKLL